MHCKIFGIGGVKKQLRLAIAGSKAAVNEKADMAIKKLAEATPKDTGRAAAGWRRDDAGDIVNDVPYIDQLNSGSSKQAPSYFIEKTLLSIPGVRPNGMIVRKDTE